MCRHSLTASVENPPRRTACEPCASLGHSRAPDPCCVLSLCSSFSQSPQPMYVQQPVQYAQQPQYAQQVRTTGLAIAVLRVLLLSVARALHVGLIPLPHPLPLAIACLFCVPQPQYASQPQYAQQPQYTQQVRNTRLGEMHSAAAAAVHVFASSDWFRCVSHARFWLAPSRVLCVRSRSMVLNLSTTHSRLHSSSRCTDKRSRTSLALACRSHPLVRSLSLGEPHVHRLAPTRFSLPRSPVMPARRRWTRISLFAPAVLPFVHLARLPVFPLRRRHCRRCFF